MNRKKRIEKILKKKLKNFDFSIKDNSILHKGHNNFDGKEETHFLLVLKPNIYLKFDRLDLHKKINNILKEEFLTGLHALEIKIIK